MSTNRSWTHANQSYLYAWIKALRSRLESLYEVSRTAQGAAVGTDLSDSVVSDATEWTEPEWQEAARPPALLTLCQLLRLSAFERGILMLCVAPALDPTMAQVYAAVQGNPPRPFATFNLALRCFPHPQWNPQWNELTPSAPLRYWQLITPVGEGPLTTQALELDERILHYLMGVTYLDPQLESCVFWSSAPTVLTPSQQALAEQIVSVWTRQESGAPLVNLYGGTSASRAAIARAAGQYKGARPYRLQVLNLPRETELRNRFQRRWEREAALGNHTLFVDVDELSLQEKPAFLETFIQRQGGRLLVSSQEPIRLAQRSVLPLEVTRATAEELQQLWRQVIGEDSLQQIDGPFSAVVGPLISQFNLDPSGIVQAAEKVRQAGHGAAPLNEKADAQLLRSRLWAACREQARLRLDDLAQRLEPVATWDDLVLPAAQMQTLRAIVSSVQQRSQVYEEWGFGQKSRRGLGISALFAGGSGTGKTMSAEVLAQALTLDLYRIDLSAVVSKYIGETEKNLRRIFDAAEQGGVILLFDEADALFGKRSDVKSSHDRHANIEVSYLLQRMESYRGLAILTTNFKNAIDAAFLRRLRFVISFPFPDAAQRAEMWRRVFPSQTPTQGLAPEKLARLTVAGGNIYSIAMNAAFLASAEASPVTMRHLLQAARSEYGKLDKKLTDTEVRGWT
ncbi:MAG: AAA family ATPase [Cyanobacteria bacterium J06614_10]